jgi:prepilin-type N-terminal cleavage/methylation domain-containing protein
MKGKKGFTLMELMIVIVIIMILTGAIVVKLGKGTERAKIAKASSEMDAIVSACRAFYSDTGYWPYHPYWVNANDASPTLGDGGLIDKNNITRVISPAGTATTNASTIEAVKNKWKGPYLEAVSWPADPWSAYRYLLYYDDQRILVVLSRGADLTWGSGSTWMLGKPDTSTTYGKDDLVRVVTKF